MSEGQRPNVGLINDDDTIGQISSALLDIDATDEGTIFRYATERLTALPNVLCALVFQRNDETNEIASYRWASPSEEPSEQPQLTKSETGKLRKLFAGNQPVFLDGDQVANPEAEGFAAFPAGKIGSMFHALVLFTKRPLAHHERSQLGLFSQVMGLAASNARLRHGERRDEEPHPVVNLIGLIAHELRTPLTGLRGNVQLALMASQKGNHERIPRRLESAIESVDAMTALVQSLLDVSRLERGIYHLDPAPTDLRATLQSAVESVKANLAPDDPSIEIEPGETLDAILDRAAFERLLSNILKKALAYREAGAPIRTAASRTPKENRITVAYRGEPFSAEHQRALTEPLHAESGPSADSRGDALPLDLAFARGVVAHHGGTIEVIQSEHGTDQTIVIHLPVARPT